MKKLKLFVMIALLAVGLAACQAESEPEVAVIPTVADAVSGDETEPAGAAAEEPTEAPAAPRPVANRTA